ncbi:unnamed protein product, partial [Rotaria sp. Silwood1]
YTYQSTNCLPSQTYRIQYPRSFLVQQIRSSSRMTTVRSDSLSNDHSVSSINTLSNKTMPMLFRNHETSLCQRIIDSFKRASSTENISLETNGSKSSEFQDHELERGTGLHRSLKNRHLQMIAIGGSIGNGLFVVSGSTFASGGPAALIFNFIITGFKLFNVAMTLGELSVAFPVWDTVISPNVSFTNWRIFS